MVTGAGGMPTKARVVTEFPHAVREVEHAWIPLADGTRLAARYWLPEDAEATPVPAILEYIPYCKRDGTSARDEAMHPYFAGHGYAAVRVDMRGSGESEGVLLDEYLKQEQDDALEVIAWLAAQPWCTGAVGMMGKSWGGFNSLQVAARRPPALKCIITVHSTDDRYADDIHYMGGCLLTDNPSWSFTMFPALIRPPDPRLAGPAWRDMWEARMAAARPWIVDWLEHQRRDAYWRHGSVCEDFSAIACPVYAIGGWADGYSNAVPRLLAGLTVPRKGLVGPWGHQYPHQAAPGPDAGFLQEALRWWDRWLKGIDTGIMDEPMFRVWMHESEPPKARYGNRAGRWVAEPSWPAPDIAARRFALNADRRGTSLDPAAGAERPIALRSPQSLGACSLAWWHKGGDAPECPPDQRPDDALSLSFDSEPLAEDLAMLGAPLVALELAADRPSALVAVRLCEVRPDGASARISYGVLNLTHRDGHEDIAPLTPGRRTRVEVRLNDNAHVFAAGSRIRVCLSTALWPLVWPSPEPVGLTVFAGASHLSLPVRPARPEDDRLAPLPPAELTRVGERTVLRPAAAPVVRLETDVASGEVSFVHEQDDGEVRIDRDGWTFSGAVTRRYRIRPDDPTSARLEQTSVDEFGRAGELAVRIEAYQLMTCDADAFHVHARLEASENGRPVYARSWLAAIPRDGL
jgi:putative CocE/NonD family hydrolase